MFPLSRALLLADAVTPDALAEALFVSATRGTSLVHALLATSAIDAEKLEPHLERSDTPYMNHVAPMSQLVQRLPHGLCERLLALPVRQDSRTGTVDVAVADTSDLHAVEEIAHWLKAPVRMVRTSLASLDAALRRTVGAQNDGLRALAPPIWLPPPPIETRVAVDPNIPFALKRKSLAPLHDAENDRAPMRDTHGERADPLLDLRRPKTTRPGAAEEQPNTVRGPFVQFLAESSRVAPAAPAELAPIAPILEEIRATRDRDAILDLVLSATLTFARRAAVLAVRAGSLVGWTCSPELAEQTALRTVRLSAAGTALASALDNDGARFVRIPLDATHAPLLWVMNVPPASDVALVAVRVAGKPVAVVLADDLREPIEGVRRLEEIAHVAGAALAEVLQHRRKQPPV
jgi:hypothetical protein